MRYCAKHRHILRKEARPPVEVMLPFVNQHKEQYGVEPICEQFGLPCRATTNTKRERDPDRLPDRIKLDMRLELDIEGAWKNNFRVYGARKVWHSCCEKALVLLAAQPNG